MVSIQWHAATEENMIVPKAMDATGTIVSTEIRGGFVMNSMEGTMKGELRMRNFGTGAMSWRKSVARLIPALVVVTASAALSIPASAAGDSMTVSGPATNTMGSDFNYVISGTASGPANRVVAWEQYNKASGCAPTFAGESVRALFQPSSLYGLTVWTNQAVSGTYSVTARFGAAHLGVHGVCAYLINFSTGQTYAHGGAFWTNVGS